MFEIYKSYYEMGLFTKQDMDNFVLADMLSAEDEAMIVGPATQSTEASQPTTVTQPA